MLELLQDLDQGGHAPGLRGELVVGDVDWGVGGAQADTETTPGGVEAYDDWHGGLLLAAVAKMEAASRQRGTLGKVPHPVRAAPMIEV